MERRRRISSSSKSETVLPSSTRPMRVVAPLMNSIASARVVLPDPLWPTSTMFRRFSVRYVFIVPPSL